MSARSQVLSGYRRLIRASQHAFRGDAFALQQARLALRENFAANRDVNDMAAIEEMIKSIDDAEGMLLHHIVQGKAKESVVADQPPRFEVKLTDPQRQAMRKDEEITPITPKSADEPIVISSGNACQRPS